MEQRGRPATGALIGRRSECAVLDDMLAALRRGESQSLVVRGDAGIGKTALLEYCVGSAADVRVLRATGVESEMELPFAVLHRLCALMLDDLDRLPAPQREALNVAFGQSAGPPPDRFMVGLAVLNLFSEVAEDRPLLCVVDDTHWLDTASAQTLTFVARRLGAEAVGLLFGTRDTGVEFRGLPHIEVIGLRNGDARALLHSVVGSLIDERISDRIIAETRGNPLALLELPRGLSATQLAGGFGLLGPHNVPLRIEKNFQRQIDALPTETRSLLLLAAAEPVGDPLLVWRAAKRLGIEVSEAVATSEMEGLLTIGHRVTFRHPLVRSAVYDSSTMSERRSVHLALAEVTDDETDPDRRAWHLASAAAGPDEDVAVELERSASRAQARGGFAAAAAFMQRCVALTEEPTRRTGRALAAASASLEAGAFDAALGLLGTAESGPLGELGRARVALLRAQAAYSLERGSDAPVLLLKAAQTLEPLDVRLARETYLDAWSSALFAGRLAVAGSLAEVSRAVMSAPRPRDPLRASDLLLDGLALLFTEGRAAGVPVLQRAATAFADGGAANEEVLRWGWLATAGAAVVWDFDTCLTAVGRQVEIARASGALAVLAVAVNVMGQAVALAGDFEGAASLMAEAVAVKEATGTHIAPYATLVHAALRGRSDEAFPLSERVIEDMTVEGQGTAVQYARWAKAVVLNALGRHEEALEAAEDASDDTPELFVASWALSERVEAAVRSGKIGPSTAALERLEEKTRGIETGWARGIQARARALLSKGKAAEDCHIEAIAQFSGTRLKPDLGRAHLMYGEWLHREGRRGDARAQLRAAHDLFTAIGMEAFADRARRALLSTGDVVRSRQVETLYTLTAQEKQIALLARDGLSNAEVAARLFLSPRTVEWHLRKVFTKLAISSRKELRTALRGQEPDLRQAYEAK